MSLFHNNIIVGVSGAGGDPVYVDDLYSQNIYHGTGSTQIIHNGIDLSTEGGLVWTKMRSSNTTNHVWVDTERGVNKILASNDTNAEINNTNYITGFSTTGYTMGGDNAVNQLGTVSVPTQYISWTFRKAPKFFDIVTYTGNGSVRTISHSLESVPGFIIVKRTDLSTSWICFHRSVGSTKFLELETRTGAETGSVYWNDTDPTSTNFTLGTDDNVNKLNGTYVAYLFAHDESVFGEDLDESIINCGSYTGNATIGKKITLGFEPQWLLIKRSDLSGLSDWQIFDEKRQTNSTFTKRLFANQDVDEELSTAGIRFVSDGFELHADGSDWNGNGAEYIYVAVARRHKPVGIGTDFFQLRLRTGDGSNYGLHDLDFSSDFGSVKWRDNNDNWFTNGRHWHQQARYMRLDGNTNLVNGNQIYIEGSGKESTFTSDSNSGANQAGGLYYDMHWRRCKGAFDIQFWTGNGSNRTIGHNLGVAPDMMWYKPINVTGSWIVYHSSRGASKYMATDSTNAEADALSSGANYFNETAPTSTQFTVGSDSNVNGSGNLYTAILFGSVDGLSKFGQYSGSTSTVNIDCGFTSGARWVLIKRIDISSNWYIFDSLRGINSGTEPYFNINLFAENSFNDYIDPNSAGFSLPGGNADVNNSGGTYIYYAIA